MVGVGVGISQEAEAGSARRHRPQSGWRPERPSGWALRILGRFVS